MLQQIHSSFDYRGDEKVTIRWMSQRCIMALVQERVHFFYFVFVFYIVYLFYIYCILICTVFRVLLSQSQYHLSRHEYRQAYRSFGNKICSM